jgi:MFS family permease
VSGGPWFEGARRRLLLVALVMGTAATSFPTTLLAASLDTIRADFHSSTAIIAWVQVAPSLAFGLGMPLLGKLGDLHGHRRVYIYGLAISTVFAFLTVFTFDPYSLIAVRTVGQIAGSATGPSGFAIIAAALPDHERARSIGLLNTVGGISPVVAVIAGGPIIDAVGWRALFLMQTVPCAIALVLALRVVPETPRRRDVRFDVAGSVTLGVGALGLLLAVNRARALGFTHPFVLISFVLWPVLWGTFVLVERRTTSPLLPLHYLKRRAFTVPSATMSVTQAAFIGSFVLAPVMVQRVFGYSVTVTSLIQVPRPIAFSVGSALAGRMNAGLTRARLQLLGNGMLVGGSFVMVAGAAFESLLLIEVALVTTGFGNGFGRTTLFSYVSKSVDTTDIGIATGVANMASQIGGAIGTTTMSVIVADSIAAHDFALSFVAGALIACLSVPVCHALRIRPAADAIRTQGAPE